MTEMPVRHPSRSRPALVALLLFLVLPASAAAQQAVTPPEAFLGFEIGADYQLATFEQLHDYWVRLAGESPRMVLDTIGLSEEGRPQVMAVITSPENHRSLDRYQAVARRLALADGVDEAEARRLAGEGKAVVWIDGGLHATEVLGAQQLMRLVYDMVSLDDPETLRFLDDVVLLAVHANPDGHALVSNWYLRNDDPMERSSSAIPLLYQKYAGHDNNRDFYMSALAETENMNRVAYREWFPQIIYNHHQTGPAGTVMFAPPFRDPPNHNIHPLMLTNLQQVGSTMHARFVAEGKGGTTMRSGAGYSTWWNGGLRTTPYFHNMIGLLTETIGHPNPLTIPFIPDRQLTHSDLPLPVEPGVWHFRQSVDYSQTANRAVLDYASRMREHLLFNIWKMGHDAIERGERDSWDNTPREIYAAEEEVGRAGDRDAWEELLRRPEDREPRGYVIPADQPDFPTAVKFANALIKNGVAVHRATGAFTAGGERYPEGSLVVRTNQAFAPFVFDMFEPQDHPDDFAYPGGPPIAPYDNAGWTLAYQMAVEFDRILDGFDGPFEGVEGFVEVPEGRVSSGSAGYVFSHAVNDAFVAVNRLLAAGRDVYWMEEPFSAEGASYPAGTFYVAGGNAALLRELARDQGLDFQGVSSAPGGEALRLRPIRIGLWDRYGGSMPSGWTRMILEDFGFDFELVFPPDLDEGNLRDRYDVLIFPDGAIPEYDPDPDATGRRGFRSRYLTDEEFLQSVPEEYRRRLGEMTQETTVPQVLEFLEEGGTVIAVGSSTELAYHAGLPVRNHLVDASAEPLENEEYYVPGSVLEVALGHETPLTHGFGDRLHVLFSRSPVFDVEPGAAGVRRIGWFDTDQPLRSGWAWGQEHLEGGTTLLEADVGAGKLFLFGPKVTFRGQSHGSFPLVFNAAYYGTAEETTLPGR